MFPGFSSTDSGLTKGGLELQGRGGGQGGNTFCTRQNPFQNHEGKLGWHFPLMSTAFTSLAIYFQTHFLRLYQAQTVNSTYGLCGGEDGMVLLF